MHGADQDSNWESLCFFLFLRKALPKPWSGLPETRACNRSGRRVTASWLNIFHLGILLPHTREKERVSQGERYFRQNQSSQLQIDALKPSERDAFGDKAGAHLGKAQKHLDWKQSASPKANLLHTPQKMGPPHLIYCIYCFSMDNGLLFIRSWQLIKDLSSGRK